EAEDDVEVVRDLVCLDSDERRLHLVDRAVELLELDTGERSEARLQLRVEVPPERDAPAHEVLPHPALRLVEGHRRAALERRAIERGRDLMLVEAVSELMHGREEALVPGREVARRQPDVGRTSSAGERVHRRVESPRIRRVPEAVEDDVAELPLLVDGEVAVQAGVVDGIAALGDLADERDQLTTHV